MKLQLKGCYTALVTPFRNGEIDYPALRELIEEQIESGVDGFVPAGTTGESPTLDVDEHMKLIETVVEIVNGRCQVIAGTGANSTKEALALTRFAREAGADASLQVTPYYNKPSQEGLYRHFSTVAETVGLPIVLYNIPGRSGLSIELETLNRLCAISTIVGIKEASGSVDRVSRILADCKIAVLSGDDSLTLPMMAVGAVGVISVASNLIPSEISRLTHSMLANDLTAAQEVHRRFIGLLSALFVETNPIPIKCALATLKKIEEEYRLPLCQISTANREVVKRAMKNCGIMS